MVELHPVRVHRSEENLPRTGQLAWKIAEVATDPVEVAPEVTRIRAAAGLPVVVGFGISTPEAAEAVARIADGCVVGSAIVRQIGEGKPVPEVLDFVRGLAEGVHRA